VERISRYSKRDSDLRPAGSARLIHAASKAAPSGSRKMSYGWGIVRSSEGSSRLLLLLVRLSWATFSPAPKKFLWKSSDRADKLLRMCAPERGALRRFSRRSRFLTSALPPGAARSKVCSPLRHASGDATNSSCPVETVPLTLGSFLVNLFHTGVGSGLVWVLTNAATQRLKDDTSPQNGCCTVTCGYRARTI
jgi:hypothetical protein